MSPEEIARILDTAAYQKKAISQLNLQDTFSLKNAYEIQRKVVERRLDRGEIPVGVKMGFTSDAKRAQMGVGDVIWGRLTNQMEIKASGTLNLDGFIHPRVEPEIAFQINQKLDHPIHVEDVRDFVSGIALALEIIDSRYENFKFSLEDVVADNCSSAAFVIGDWESKDLLIEEEELELWIDNQLIHKGASSAIMGNPFQSLVDAIRLSLDNGVVLEKGSIVLAGAVTPAVYLKADQKVECTSRFLGSVDLYTQSR